MARGYTVRGYEAGRRYTLLRVKIFVAALVSVGILVLAILVR